MDNEDIGRELKAEEEYQEVKEWEDGDSEDDFKTWKLKKYINERILFAIIVSVVITFLLLKVL